MSQWRRRGSTDDDDDQPLLRGSSEAAHLLGEPRVRGRAARSPLQFFTLQIRRILAEAMRDIVPSKFF